MNNLENKCKWKFVAERDERYKDTSMRILPEDSICQSCDGYNSECKYYLKKFPISKEIKETEMEKLKMENKMLAPKSLKIKKLVNETCTDNNAFDVFALLKLNQSRVSAK